MTVRVLPSRVFGLPLTEWPHRHADRGAVLVRCRVASIPPAHGFVALSQAPPLDRLFWKRSRTTRSILWEGRALLSVSARGVIRIDTAPGTEAAAITVLNLGLALLLAGRGQHFLHAAGLARPGRGAAILGPPGAGKSSLTPAGARPRLEVVSD